MTQDTLRRAAPALTDADRARLAARIKARRNAPAAGIPALPAGAPAPASHAQEQLWLIDSLGSAGHAYNVYHALRLDGPLDPARLRAALDGLVALHESLRTHVRSAEPHPTQHIDAPAPVALTETDLRGRPQEEVDARVLAVCREPFDLADGPKLRAELVHLAADSAILVLSMPHIATDGWSTRILAEDLAALYGGGAPDRPAVRYRDFAAWQRERLSGERLRAELEHWRTALAGQPQVLQLPTDRPRPVSAQYSGAEVRAEVPAATVRALRALAESQGASMYALLLAAVRTLLRAHSAQDRFILASSIAGRSRPELERVVGYFVNTLALAGDLSGDPGFTAALAAEQATVLAAFDHAELPFDVLVRELAEQRDASRNPLAQVFVQLDRGGHEGWSLPGLRVAELPVDNDVAKFDLSFFFHDDGEGVSFTLEYATALYEPATARRLAERLVELLGSIAARPNQPISTLSLVPAAELRTLTDEWNDTAADFPAATLPELIAERARGGPDRPAVSCGPRTLSYAELDRRANRLANHLRAFGVGRGDLVAVFLDRGVDLPAALLAVLKTGAAYVPLNPGEPADRIALILQDAAPALILTQADLAAQLPDTGRLLLLAEQEAMIAAADEGSPGVVCDPEELAYVIFTSGSTGRPKGVAIPHGALTNFLHTMARRPGITEDDVLVAVTTPSFDIAALELFLPLISGAHVVVADRATQLDALRLRRLIGESGATMMQATPATWRMLLDAPELARLTVLVGGEALTADVAAPLARNAAAVWNMYGPTETTIWSTVRRIEQAEALAAAGALPIGRPIGNTVCHILDGESLAHRPAGVPGELFIGGDGVARGYYGRPALTAERFVPDPFGPPGSRLYRTGDMARYRPDGDIEFLGRNDHQVKVRGYRIETGEIETHLAAHEHVAQAVVTAHEFGPGDVRLVGYLTAAPGREPEPAALRAYLADKLPEYMVPGVYLVLEGFPLTPNRKVDRKALPAPQSGPAGADAQDAAPNTPTERLVADTWAEVLGSPVPGVHADFFGLGGHSLLAVRAVNRINAVLGTSVEVRALLEAPTVRSLAARLDAAAPAGPAARIPRAPRDVRQAPSRAQERLWFLDQLSPGGADYNLPIELGIEGPLDLDALRAALHGLTVRHEALRTRLRPGSNGKLYAEASPPSPFELPIEDAADDAAAERAASAEAARPFNLAADPMLRARLIRIAPLRHLLVLTVHHAAADGASLEILRRELATGYRDAVAGRDPAEAARPEIEYRDFAAWQRTRETEDAAQLDYWRSRLADLGPLELPVDRPRPPVRRGDGAAYRFVLPGSMAEDAAGLARRQATTPFVVLLAAFQTALAEWTGQRDIPVTTPVSNRVGEQCRDVVGMFVNTLLIRARIGERGAFAETVGLVKTRVAEALAHQQLPFERVVDEVCATRDLSRPALSPVHFTYADAGDDGWRLDGLDVTRGPERILGSRYELSLGLDRTAAGLEGIIEYSPILFDPDTVAGFAETFHRLLAAALADPAAALLDAPRELAAADPRSAPGGSKAPARAPQGPAEQLIAGIFGDVLGTPVTDANADFFALGGHSLLAARVRLRLQARFGVDLPMHRLFEGPTVAALAVAVREAIEAELAEEPESTAITEEAAS